MGQWIIIGTPSALAEAKNGPIYKRFADIVWSFYMVFICFLPLMYPTEIGTLLPTIYSWLFFSFHQFSIEKVATMADVTHIKTILAVTIFITTCSGTWCATENPSPLILYLYSVIFWNVPKLLACPLVAMATRIDKCTWRSVRKCPHFKFIFLFLFYKTHHSF